MNIIDTRQYSKNQWNIFLFLYYIVVLVYLIEWWNIFLIFIRVHRKRTPHKFYNFEWSDLFQSIFNYKKYKNLIIIFRDHSIQEVSVGSKKVGTTKKVGTKKNVGKIIPPHLFKSLQISVQSLQKKQFSKKFK